VGAIYEHTRKGLFDYVVINNAHVSPRLLRRYHAQGAEPVRASLQDLAGMGLRTVTGNLLQQDGVLRHDPERLTRLLLKEFIERPPNR
jgi:2-phospho-L-lactate transferase/gluconeogenesis factor (CofD/UPF0052 family)